MTDRIVTADDLARGTRALVALEPRFAPVIAADDPLPLRLRDGGFAALLDIIVSQQVSTVSAAAIWTRLEAARLTTPEAMRAASDEDLRAVGLTRPKQRYARALAASDLDYDTLEQMDTEAVVARLTALPGIGRWSAEIYAQFSLGHADAFAAGDLALQESARMLFGLPSRPSEVELRVMAEAWRPWRAVAARALWSYYLRAKNMDEVS